jgi:hypothetical protein
MAKDQFIQKMSDGNQEAYSEYLQPVFMLVMAALKMGLQPTFQQREELNRVIKAFYHRIAIVSTYITGSKMDQAMKLFYMYMARMHVSFDVASDDPTPVDAASKVEEQKVVSAAMESAIASSEEDSPAPGGVESDSDDAAAGCSANSDLDSSEGDSLGEDSDQGSQEEQKVGAAGAP